MALAITMKEGDRVYADDMPIRIERVTHSGDVVASTKDGTYPVTPGKWTKVNDLVSLRVGKAANLAPGEVRMLFAAPQRVRFLREQFYGKPKPAPTVKKSNGSGCGTCHGTRYLKSRAPCGACRGAGCGACNQTGIVMIEFRCPDCGD